MKNPVIAYQNLPPNYSWLFIVWMSAISIKVWDLNPGWYYALGMLTLVMAVGWWIVIKHAVYIDLFEVLRKDSK